MDDLIVAGTIVIIVAMAIVAASLTYYAVKREQFRLEERELRLREQEKSVELKEWQIAAELRARNIDQHAALEAAELERKRAEAVAAATTANHADVLEARKLAELEVIEAAKQARILAAQHAPSPNGTAALELLLGAYDEYNRRYSSYSAQIPTFDEWLGSVRVSTDGTLT